VSKMDNSASRKQINNDFTLINTIQAK